VLGDRGRGSRAAAAAAGRDGAGVEDFDVATQLAVSHHWWVVDGRPAALSAPVRDVWPSELDLMARLAGMWLRERRGDWSGGPFTGHSTSHVSVWEEPGSQRLGLRQVDAGCWALLSELADAGATAWTAGCVYAGGGGKDGIRTHGRVATSTVFEVADRAPVASGWICPYPV
jgi:hypothetical protein